MRNSVVFKFIALLLCAVSLLGAVACGAGILVLTETGLYNKTAQELYQENLEMFSEERANALAKYYANKALGGCTEEMLQDYLHLSGTYPFVSDRFGYVLRDAEGNELERRYLISDQEVTTFTIPVTGQYMHLVKLSSESMSKAEEERYSTSVFQEGVKLDRIPAEGCGIFEIGIQTIDGASWFTGDTEAVAFRNEAGQLILRCPRSVVEEPVTSHGLTISALALWDEFGELVYLANEPEGIGILRSAQDQDSLIFEAYVVSEEIPEETVPAQTYTVGEIVAAPEEAMTETIPEATGEEASDETAPETQDQTLPEETAEAAQTEATEESTEAVQETAEEETAQAQTEETAAEDAGEDTQATEAAGEETISETTGESLPGTEPTVLEETVPAETLPPVEEPVRINGKRLDEYQINRITYWDGELQEEVTAKFIYLPMPELTVEFSVAPNALNDSYLYTVLAMLREIRSYLMPVLGICLLILAVSAVYLCCAAGRKPKCDTVQAGGLNRMPIDLYFLLGGSGIAGAFVLAVEGGAYFLQRDIFTGCVLAAGLGLLASLLIVGFFFALVAQIKTPGGFWWRNSLVGKSLKLVKYLWHLFLRLCGWLDEKFSEKALPVLKRLLTQTGKKTRRFSGRVLQGIERFLELLPVTWQWMLTGCAMVLLLFVTVASRFDLGMVLSILAAFALILYGAHCFGTLMEAIRKMNKGNLDSKVDDKLMVGAFKTFAGDMNDLAGVVMAAAQKQLKSERMKTELITNVSHDIKTPLTSIINYVDLLQKPHTEEEQVQYLEVLDRQSQRLKKLIDDLMDMSKASTGNMAVDITLVDAVESVNQALGEFADKLERAQVIPVFRHMEDSVEMMADGRLVWRVLSNLLGNAVKYAMPGTRLYIDLMRLENQVVISLKNISRDELNVDADELMERFVRGDDARNTEGSGLGLNIAKSLMELQKGQLQLLVDGDLFKVTLIFPGL